MDAFDYEGSEAIARAWREGLTPDPLLSVSEWADQYRMLSSKSAAEPGRWRTRRTPYLKEIMDCLSPTSPVERVVFMKGAQVGGPLALDTPLPTVDGWTTMGDVTVGDWLFDECGQPCRVTGVSPTFFDRDGFTVCFDDGERVICDADHRWPVWDFTHDIPARKTLTTRQMLEKVRLGTKRYRYGIDVCNAVELPLRDLLIHPYVLGLWLGDGNSVANHLSVHEDDEEIVEHLQACGVQATFRHPTWRKGRCANVVIDPTPRLRDRFEREGNSFATHGSRFTHHLRMLDVLDNKHIPSEYLRASKEQRLALLQGLMDSDGSITPDGKRCEFGNTNPRLIEGVKELLGGLGYKASIYAHSSKTKTYLNGAFYTSLPGWRISWTAYAEEPMFRLSRKVARLRSQARGKPARAKRRRIVDIQPVPSVPVRCIEVDSPSHLYLCGKGWIPTHNTECGNNFIGFVIHLAPGPMMAVAPTVEMAKRNSKQRIDPLIEESQVLLSLIAPARSRDAGNTILTKEFRGGILVMTGANSAVGLRSMPVRYLFLDEVDGYPRDVDGEGDAISLAEARTRTFARRKIFIVSTPTITGASVIEREYEASDQRRYFVPCPHCGHRQWLKFEQLRWTWSHPESVHYICASCGEAIGEHHKTWMLEQGEWRSTSEDPGRKTVGFHLSSLYSPIGWRAWSEIASAWESAQGSATALKAFKNTELGETWVEEGDAPDWERLFERREDYVIGRVPLSGLLLTAGADIQKDRIEVSVWAFGRGKSAWLIEHRVLMGPVYAEAGARDSVWKKLAALLHETWTHESGAQLPLSRLAVDTGFATQEAYAFVRACKDARALAVKGIARGATLIGSPTAVDVTLGGKKLRRGIKLFSVAGPIAKLELYNNLRKNIDIDEDGEISYPAGFVHLPKIDAEFVQQLCAEQLVTRRDRNGFPVREWQKMRERNEGLDCYVYSRAAAANAGLDRFEERHWGELEKQLGLTSTVPVETPRMSPVEFSQNGGLSTTSIPKSPRRLIRSRWLG